MEKASKRFRKEDTELLIQGIKARVGSITPDKLLRITTISTAAGKLLTQDVLRLIEIIDQLEKESA